MRRASYFIFFSVVKCQLQVSPPLYFCTSPESIPEAVPAPTLAGTRGKSAYVSRLIKDKKSFFDQDFSNLSFYGWFLRCLARQTRMR